MMVGLERAGLARPTMRGPEGLEAGSSALPNADLNASGTELLPDEGAGRLRIVGAKRRAADHAADPIKRE